MGRSFPWIHHIICLHLSRFFWRERLCCWPWRSELPRCEGAIWQGIVGSFQNWEQPPPDSQWGNGDLSPTTSRTWILCELGRVPRAPERKAASLMPGLPFSITTTWVNHLPHIHKCFWRAYCTKWNLLLNIAKLPLMAVPIYTPTMTSHVWQCPLTNICHNMSLITNEAEHPFIYLLATWFYLLWNALFTSFVHFSIGLFVLFYWFIEILINSEY